MKKNIWITAFTLTGTAIGAGILGLPYVFAQSGFLVGFFWLLFLGIIMIYVNLAIGEITLRTKGIHHLPGLAEKYLGKNGRKIMFFSLAFGIYSALVAYLVGEGESLSRLFFDTSKYALYFGIIFWLLITLLLREGLKALKKVESYGVIILSIIIIGIFVWLLPNIDVNNLNKINHDKLLFPFGVILFSLLGFSAVPELRRLISGSENHFKNAIFIGMFLSIFLYFLFSIAFVGFLGIDTPSIATLSLDKIVIFLGIFTMLTSYFVLSFALKDIFIYDLNSGRITKFIFVSLFPLILYLISVFFEIGNFISILSWGGIISGGLTIFLSLIMGIRAKKLGNRKPEYSVPLNWMGVIILSLVFLLGIVSLFW